MAFIKREPRRFPGVEILTEPNLTSAVEILIMREAITRNNTHSCRLGLTTVRRREPHPDLDQCELRQSKELYLAIFSSDLILFYLLPLLVAVIGCYKMAQVLRKNAEDFSSNMGLGRLPQSRLSPRFSTQSFPPYEQVPGCGMLTHRQIQRHDSVQTSRTQVRLGLMGGYWVPIRS